MEAICSSELSIDFHRTPQNYIPEDKTVQTPGKAQSVPRQDMGRRAGLVFRQGYIFLSSITSRPALEPIQSPIPRVPGALSPGVKRQGSEADHSPPSSAEVKFILENRFMRLSITRRFQGTRLSRQYGQVQ
jgi:hypothetical protein